MKSKHLAKADFLRELKALTKELYKIGDSSSKNPEWKGLSSKLTGFIDAGLILQVATRSEIQDAIDSIHLEIFSETREARRERKAKSMPDVADAFTNQDGTSQWRDFDSPAYERNGKN